MSEHIPQPSHAHLSNEPVEFAAEDFPPVTSGHVKIKEGTRVLTGMTAVKFDVITISSGVLRAHSNSPEPSVVIAQGTAAVHAYGNVRVLASDKARVYTYNGPYAVATGSSTVTALGTGTVVTYDTASARIHDNVTGVAGGASGIEAHDTAVVECTDTARLSLHGQSVGVARGASIIDVHDSARALAFGSVTADVYGGHVDLRERSKAVIQVPADEAKKQADGNYALIREGVGYGSVAVHNSASVETLDDLRTPSAPFTPSAAEAAAAATTAPAATPTAEPVTPAVAPTGTPDAGPVTATTVAPATAPSTAEEVVTVNDTVDAPTETASPSALITVGRSGVSATETEAQDQYLGTSVEPASPDERVDSTQSVAQLEELGWTVVTKPSGAYQPFERVDLAAQIDKESSNISNQPATSSESKPKSERKGFNLPKPPESANDGGFTIPGLNLAGN